jgi:hypothetical protein
MIRRYSKHSSILLPGALLMLAVVANPAQAHYNDDVFVPFAAGVVLGSIFYHGHRHHNHYSKHRHGYYGHSGHYGKQYRRRAYSSGHGGYNRKSQSRGYGHKSRPVYRH